MEKFRYRLWLIAITPLEVIGLTFLFAAKGFRMGIENTRDAWRGSR